MALLRARPHDGAAGDSERPGSDFVNGVAAGASGNASRTGWPRGEPEVGASPLRRHGAHANAKGVIPRLASVEHRRLSLGKTESRGAG